MIEGAYIVQCDGDNFQSVQNLLKIFSTVIEVDAENFTIKSGDIDGILKQKIADLGASFWQEAEYAVANLN